MSNSDFELAIKSLVKLINTYDTANKIINGSCLVWEGPVATAIDNLTDVILSSWCKNNYPEIYENDDKYCRLFDCIYNCEIFDLNEFIKFCNEMGD